ncbi:MAG: CARDB domain-containing protein [Candidatus Thermoplasmatota archaeon]|nr:CARDB domain-containing protein [Candidatus Thermoplasmatota archaeon]
MGRAMAFIFATTMIMILSLGPVDAQVDDSKLPDIRFEGRIEISGSTSGGPYDGMPGDVLTIIVKVSNNGSTPAENVNVQFLVDGVEKKLSILRSLKNDTDDVKTVIFSWVAESGKHGIMIEIDPDNSIAETNDQFTGSNNNILTREISIGGKLFDGGAVPFPGIFFIFSSLVPVLILSLWKRKK